jgi:CRP/FNR family cyclic AMP-dependent transcriptional regulator
VLLSFCTEKKLSPDEVIFKEGEIGNSLFIIKSSEVKIYKKDALSDVDIARLGAGTIFGEMAIVDNKPRSANVKAVSECLLMEMTRESYYSLIKDAPEVGVKFIDILLNTLAFRLREANKKIFNLLSGV